MTFGIIGSLASVGAEYPGNAPAEAFRQKYEHERRQAILLENDMRAQKARERREWQEAAKRGIPTYDAAKASQRR